MKKSIITLILIGFSPFAFSNSINESHRINTNFLEIITPNNLSINTQKIADYTSNYIVYFKNDKNERESVGMYKEQLQRIQLNEEQTLRVKRESIINGKPSIDLTMVSAQSLKPRYSISKENDLILMLNFDGNEVQGEIVLDGISSVFTEKNAVPIFDMNSSDLVLRALPLKMGYTATFWAYNADKMNSIDYQTITVVGETASNKNKSANVESWIVKKSNSDATSYYTIEKKTHAILKIEIALAPDKTMVIERL